MPLHTRGELPSQSPDYVRQWRWTNVNGGLPRPPGEPLRERRNGFGVYAGLVPFQQDVEVSGSFAPRLAAAPAVALEIVRRGGERVGSAVDEVAFAVAVEVHRELQIGRGQELGLPDLACPIAAQFARRHVAALDDAKQSEKLAAELVGPAAVVSEGGNRSDD